MSNTTNDDRTAILHAVRFVRPTIVDIHVWRPTRWSQPNIMLQVTGPASLRLEYTYNDDENNNHNERAKTTVMAQQVQ